MHCCKRHICSRVPRRPCTHALAALRLCGSMPFSSLPRVWHGKECSLVVTYGCVLPSQGMRSCSAGYFTYPVCFHHKPHQPLPYSASGRGATIHRQPPRHRTAQFSANVLKRFSSVYKVLIRQCVVSDMVHWNQKKPVGFSGTLCVFWLEASLLLPLLSEELALKTNFHLAVPQPPPAPKAAPGVRKNILYLQLPAFSLSAAMPWDSDCALGIGDLDINFLALTTPLALNHEGGGQQQTGPHKAVRHFTFLILLMGYCLHPWQKYTLSSNNKISNIYSKPPSPVSLCKYALSCKNFPFYVFINMPVM